MALGAVLRCHGRMDIARDLPAGRAVTCRAVASEQFAVRISIAVAIDTIEAGPLFRLRSRNSQNALEVVDH
ncbi:hypothetical protein ACQ1Z2_16010, partial [Enterococcus faecalis]